MPQSVPSFFIFEFYSQLLFGMINIDFLLRSIIILLFSLLGLYFAYDYYPITKPMTGVRCPTCLANGQESWVIPGKTCGYCDTGC